MSDFIVKAIVDQLADAGCPLTAQQVNALVDVRKKSMAKAREEIKNAVRASLLKDGIDTSDIKRAAREMTQDTVNNTLKERNIEQMVDAQIQKAIAAAFSPATDIKLMVKSAIEREAAKVAHEYIKTNMKVDVSINETGHYVQGGTF